jgi:hypothetical protein
VTIVLTVLLFLLNNYKVGLKMTLIDHMHLISITASHEGGSQRPLDKSIRIAARYSFLSNAFFQSSITRKRVDWHPNPERKAARNGLKIFSK